MMESQIQCPVCTLYLHAGMNLQDHLESHPKEKVIAALVNLTLFRQQSSDDCTEEFDSNQYETSNQLSETQRVIATPNNAARTYHQNKHLISSFSEPIQQHSVAQTAHQVMIVDRTRVFHEKSNIAINDESTTRSPSFIQSNSITTAQPKIRTIPVQALQLIATNGLTINQQIQSLRPPPPYCVSVKDNILKQNGLFAQQSEPSSTCTDSFALESQRSKNQHHKILTTTLNQHNVIGFDGIDPIKKCTQNIYACDQMNSAYENEYESNEDGKGHLSHVYPERNPTLPSCSKLYNGNIAVNALPSVDAEQSTDAIASSSYKMERNVERRTAGLQVISNVKVIPNTVLNMTSLNPHIGDAMSMKDVLIIGAASTSQKIIPKASTSRASSYSYLSGNDKLDIDNQKGSNTASEIGKDKTIHIDSDDDEDKSSKTTGDSSPGEDSVACSSKATSVIRMASQTAPYDIKNSTASVKVPYNRPPKKLVVKLKKPFVPVIGEEANLHPPENRTNSTSSAFNTNNAIETVPAKNNVRNVRTSENSNLMLEGSEDVPYSPIRQSYTPQLPFDMSQDVGEPKEVPNEIIEAKYDPCCSYQLGSKTLRPNRMCFDETTGHTSNQSALKHKNEVIVFEISIEDSKELQNVENDTLWDMNNDDKSGIESKLDNDSIMPSTSSCRTASTSFASEPATSNMALNAMPNPDSPNITHQALPKFHHNNENFSNVDYNQLPNRDGDAGTSNTQFSSKYKYISHESDKQISYVNNEKCKYMSGSERAPSADSLNIITDEKMPAKGEISEQESNGDIESSWSHQLFLDNENLPRYTSSYDTTIARESWSLSNEQNLPHEMENMSTILSNFTMIEQSDVNIDVKPLTENLVNDAESSKGKLLVRSRKYKCSVCSQIFASLKEKRVHLIDAHNYQEAFSMIRDATKSFSKIQKSNRPIATITSGGSTSTLMSYDNPLINCKLETTESTQITKPFASLNNYLLNYNWNTLRDRSLADANLEKIFSIIDSGTNYVCKICEEKFNSIRAYDIHMVVHPAECYTCGRTFKRWVNFSIHLKRHLNIREHCCSHCPKRFVLRQNMIEHMRIHSNEAPLKCGICMKRFKRYSNLIQHRNRHHLKLRPKDKDYICSCGEVFHSEAKIAWHKETHDAKPKCCPYCRERFMHKNSLVRHIRLSHTERFHLFKRDSVECPFCKKKYIKSSLKVHMEQHKASKTTYECTICNKSLTTKWNLKQHKWIHASRSSKPFKCTTCTKAFVRETEYISHMNTHKSIKPYTCDHCGCQFARKYNWLRHTREHTTPKNFRCDTCYKVFHRAYYLKEHKRSHTGERPFECAICGKTSTTKTNHNKHVKIHHARDPLTAEV